MAAVIGSAGLIVATSNASGEADGVCAIAATATSGSKTEILQMDGFTEITYSFQDTRFPAAASVAA
jgi:hypothetical protein